MIMESAQSENLGIHDKCKQVIMFHNNLIKFLKTLKRTLPETSQLITDTVNYYKSVSRAAYIKETHQLLDQHIKYITENDFGIFTDDYAVGPRYLLPPRCDFRLIWDIIEQAMPDSAEAELTMTTIFKHLQALYVNCNVALAQIGIFNTNLEKQRQHLLNMLENLSIDDEVRKRIEEMKTEEAAGSMSLENLASMLGEDNIIVKIAQDIANEMDLGIDNVDNPVEALTSLFANDGKKIKELIVTLGDKLEKRIASGEIDTNKFMSDAKKATEKLSSNPIFNTLVQSAGLNRGKIIDIYSSLSSDDQSKYENLPELLNKDASNLSDGEREIVASFLKEHMVTQSDVPDPELSADGTMPVTKPKTKVKPKPKRR